MRKEELNKSPVRGRISTMSQQPVHNCKYHNKSETSASPFITCISGEKCAKETFHNNVLEIIMKKYAIPGLAVLKEKKTLGRPGMTWRLRFADTGSGSLKGEKNFRSARDDMAVALCRYRVWQSERRKKF